MIKIRLARLGSQNTPISRLGVADARDARTHGRPLAT